MEFELTNGSYKSIKNLLWKDIPDFAVITGKNGTGKSQLLELMNFHFSYKESEKQQMWQAAANPFYNVRTKSDLTISVKEVVYIPSVWNLSNLDASGAQQFSQVLNVLHNQIVSNCRNEEYAELASTLIARIGKEKSQITLRDVQENLPIDYFDFLHKIQIHEGLNEAFLAYHGKSAELRDLGKENDEIRATIGIPPWEVINDMLDKADFPYTIKKPISYLGDYHFELLAKKDSSLSIKFSDLSSGEKVLLALSVWMFNGSKSKRLPKLLLLDEPDAHLHPSAVKQFINVIENSLVKNFGLKVIMTTHSPSTVALSPEYSLFEMSKESPQIKPLKSKEYGIGLLTEGLVVVKSNSKYVLVEDKDDAKFYKEVFSILKNDKLVNEHITVVFIPASNKSTNTSGGCTVVRSWVEKFVKEGADDIFQGLMDYDNGTNKKETVVPTKNLHVISRYSLENYLLDPILVFSSLMHDNSGYSVSGIELSHRDEHKIASLTENELQIIADKIFSEVELTIYDLREEEKQKEEINFTNGKRLLYPKWFLNRRGHDLYSLFKLKFTKAINHNLLINALERQRFIPSDLQATILNLQK
jgi:energy-coupling factor transporter ATP-binding protein EcfA2